MARELGWGGEKCVEGSEYLNSLARLTLLGENFYRLCDQPLRRKQLSELPDSFIIHFLNEPTE